MNKPGQNIERAYEEAVNYAESHYENFPVISAMIKKDLRKDIAVIYWFARTADDIADEDEIPEENKLEELEAFENRFRAALKGNYESSLDAALHNTVMTRRLSAENFFNLLQAFKQDVTKKRYNNYDELQNYCSNSAAPVGRLILELHGIYDPAALKYSDKICTALQLTNFWQDVSVDYQKERIYIPIDEMKRFSVTEAQLSEAEADKNFRELLKHQISRTEKLFHEGRELLKYLPYKLRVEINWTIAGGETILEKIARINYDTLNKRPVISKFKKFSLLIKSIIYAAGIRKRNI